MKTKLPKRLKDKWIKALLSGKYKQGRESLCQLNSTTKEYEYCCMGVLGEICKVPREILMDHGIFIDITLDIPLQKRSSLKNIPLVLMEEYSSKGSSNLVTKLVVFNDEKERSFKWIAAYIKRYL